MYWLWIYNQTELTFGHEMAEILCSLQCGPGFLNAVNRFYGYRVWR